MTHRFRIPVGPRISRRTFVQGLTAGGLLGGLALPDFRGLRADEAGQGIDVLRGSDFDLRVGATAVNFTGTPSIATTVNGSVPAPVLRWREGDRVRLRVANLLAETSSIHWHGIILPAGMDGVPGISFPGIAAGESFTYEFDVRQNGTYWYHSHSGFQEQTGMFGAIVIDPSGPDPVASDRDYVVMLSDWSDAEPESVYANLKKQSHYYNMNPRTIGQSWQEVRERGVAASWREREMWNEMRMNDRDISDVTGLTYTFLMNGRTPADGWTALFSRGEKIRLRFINAAAMTYFDVRIPGLRMTVVAADGQYVEPVTVDEFRLGVAETLDVVVEPSDDRAWCVFAQAIDRSGYARGTLTPDPELMAMVPPLDPVPLLSHIDMAMGGSPAGHDMAAMNSATGQSVSGSKGGAGMDHSMHGGGGMPMDHAAAAGGGAAATDHSRHAAGNSGVTDHALHSVVFAAAGQGSSAPIVHAATEFGVNNEMRADAPQFRLNDPGPGLRNNGRKVLVYGDLRNRYATPDPREPEREIQLHLTGNMWRYMWSFDGVRHADAEPLRMRYGERLRITLVNDTMMHHPIHMHGMWSDLETGDGARIPRKHTVSVQPGQKLSYLISADAPGSWAYHCHMMYHMGGMFRTVVVS